MDFDVLPGPSLPEIARTALARAATATVTGPSLLGVRAGGQVPVRATHNGNPLLLPANGSLIAAWLAASPHPVRVSLPAGPPFATLRLTGRMTTADWVVPRGLDRYGLELLVFTPDGVAAVRLSFPDGPVSSLEEVPVSVRAALTCRCHARPGPGQLPGTCDGHR
jgi:hypothetical protein